MMSPGVIRGRTQRRLQQVREQFGDLHPATFAASGRASIAWEDRIRQPPQPELSVRFTLDTKQRLVRAYTVARNRMAGDEGFDNRHDRKRRERCK